MKIFVQPIIRFIDYSFDGVLLTSGFDGEKDVFDDSLEFIDD